MFRKARGSRYRTGLEIFWKSTAMTGNDGNKTWSVAAAAELKSIIKTTWRSPERFCAVKAPAGKISAKTIRNWYWTKGESDPERIFPSTDLLATLCDLLVLPRNYFQPFIDGTYQKRSARRHPHNDVLMALQRELNDEATDVVQILAPPGYLKTVVLKDLESRIQREQSYKCIRINANDATGIIQLWSMIADGLVEEGLTVSKPAREDYFTVVSRAVRTTPTVLLIDDCDSWMVNMHISRDDASSLLSRLRDISCLVIVAGFIDIGYLSLITGGPDSFHHPRTLDAMWNDHWKEWTAAVCADYGVSAAKAKADLERGACRHAGAFLHGVRAHNAGRDAVDAMREYHESVGHTILERVGPRLRTMLTGKRLKKLEPRIKEILCRGRILVEERGRWRPAIEEWSKVWMSASA